MPPINRNAISISGTTPRYYDDGYPREYREYRYHRYDDEPRRPIPYRDRDDDCN